jgi:hypothetical protein
MSCINEIQQHELPKSNAIEYLKGLTENELQFIASLDYGTQAEKHHNSIKSVITRDGIIHMETEYWFPYEVIELGANHLEIGHEREYTGCLLIIIINVLNGNDMTKFLDDYLYDRSTTISALPESEKLLIENLYFSQQGKNMTFKHIKDT